ncbi:very-long-chain (3R)-3-hydroxyacyl-CoA dehydratase 2 [Schistocerca nitens]|uniref:very-long-chain (3R)-3-hydroxyacyl-CoA dehydratase 2 n=1 Tax=Schistocerca nitens TaxID=7011 RepID=UPI0021179C69|nr:very-long-chain (3R)-3-hydroxyacyl-CoA dehydratase 2 [Schistocerca nitens]
MAKKSQTNVRKGPGTLGTAYLFAYNVVQFLGWSYILFLTIRHHLQPSKSVILWEVVKLPICIFQNAAALEILHAALKLVPSSVVVTTFQVFSRVFAVCGVLLATPTAPLSIGVSLAMLAWSISEITRYLYYALNIAGFVPYALIWCRYTFFMVLYPIGITGELLCMYAAQTYVSKTNMWSVSLPNPFNFTFSYSYFVIIIMLLYIPIFPQLFLHMVSQRRKFLGSPSTKKEK